MGQTMAQLHEGEVVQSGLMATKILAIWRLMRERKLRVVFDPFLVRAIRFSAEAKSRAAELFDTAAGKYLELTDESDGSVYTSLDERFNNDFLCFVCRHRCRLQEGRVAAVYTICKDCEKTHLTPLMTRDEYNAYLDSAVHPRFLVRVYRERSEQFWQMKIAGKLDEHKAQAALVQAAIDEVLTTFTALTSDQLAKFAIHLPQKSGVRFRDEAPAVVVSIDVMPRISDDWVPEPTTSEMERFTARDFSFAIRSVWMHLRRMKLKYENSYGKNWYIQLKPESAGHKEKVARIEEVFQRRFPDEFPAHVAYREMREIDRRMTRLEPQMAEARKPLDPEMAAYEGLFRPKIEADDYAFYELHEARWLEWRAAERMRKADETRAAQRRYDSRTSGGLMADAPDVVPEGKSRLAKAEADRVRAEKERKKNERRQQLHDAQPKGRKGESPPKHGVSKDKKKKK